MWVVGSLKHTAYFKFSDFSAYLLLIIHFWAVGSSSKKDKLLNLFDNKFIYFYYLLATMKERKNVEKAGSWQPKKSSAGNLFSIFFLIFKEFLLGLWAVGSLKIHTHIHTECFTFCLCYSILHFLKLTHLQSSGLWTFGRPYKRAQLCLLL